MNLVYYVSATLSYLAIKTFFRGRHYNPERVPATGPVILASNHASYIDPPYVGSALSRETHYLARENLFRNPLMAAYLRKLNVVPVDRDGGGGPGLKAILERLKAGNCILLFPEGTRTPDGTIRPAKAGIGLVIIKSECAVVPVRLFGTFEAYGRHRKFPLPLPTSAKYGFPMEFKEQRAEAATCSKARLKEIYQEVSDRVMAEIRNLRPCEDITSFP